MATKAELQEMITNLRRWEGEATPGPWLSTGCLLRLEKGLHPEWIKFERPEDARFVAATRSWLRDLLFLAEKGLKEFNPVDLLEHAESEYLLSRGWTQPPTGHSYWIDPLKPFDGYSRDEAVAVQRRRDEAEGTQHAS